MFLENMALYMYVLLRLVWLLLGGSSFRSEKSNYYNNVANVHLYMYMYVCVGSEYTFLIVNQVLFFSICRKR